MDSSIPENLIQCTFNFETLSTQPVEDLPLSVDPALPQKKCRGDCNRILPVTREYFYPQPANRDKFKNLCIQCFLARDRAKRQASSPRPPEGYKHCRGCNRDLPATLEYFGRSKEGKDGLRYNCKECRNKHEIELRQNRIEGRRAYEKQFRETHREAIRENNRRYERETKGRRAEYFKEYYKAHPEVARRASRKFYHLHRAECLESLRSYRQSHRDYFRAAHHLYRARKHNNGGKHTPADVRLQYDRQKGRCYYCHKKVTKYHVDHVFPISRGGSNGPENLVIACPTCNLRKSDKLLHEWIDGGRLI